MSKIHIPKPRKNFKVIFPKPSKMFNNIPKTTRSPRSHTFKQNFCNVTIFPNIIWLSHEPTRSNTQIHGTNPMDYNLWLSQELNKSTHGTNPMHFHDMPWPETKARIFMAEAENKQVHDTNLMDYRRSRLESIDRNPYSATR